MGPKTKQQTTEIIQILGSKISTIIIGNNENNNILNYKINLNCPLDIILDYVKKQFIIILENKIREIENKLQENNNNLNEENNNSNLNPTNNNSTNNNSNNTQNLNSNEREKIIELQSKYIKLKKLLIEENITNLELFDGTNCLYCQQVKIISFSSFIYFLFLFI